MVILTLGVLTYFGIQGYRYFNDPLTTTAAYAYEVEEGVDLSGYNKQVFADVPANAYYAKAIHWATDNGIISGYNATTFGVGDSLTREQLVTILSRYAQKNGVNVNPTAAAINKMNTYSDANKINPYMKNAIAWALQNRVINGMTDTTIAPQGNATRAQVAAILMNINAYGVIPGI